MSQEWYYSVDGDRQGPISAGELKKLADAGTVKPGDLVWKDGMSDWVQAKSIKGLWAGTAAAAAAKTSEAVSEKPAQAEDAEERPSARGRQRDEDQDEDRPRRRRDQDEDEDRPRSRRRDEEEGEDRPARRRRDEDEDRPRRRKGGRIPEDVSSKKMVAGLLGILLNCLGIHKFYLGMTGAGLTMLLVSVLTCGIGAIPMQIIGLIEGIIYLTKSDDDFYEIYIVGQKAWF